MDLGGSTYAVVRAYSVQALIIQKNSKKLKNNKKTQRVLAHLRATVSTNFTILRAHQVRILRHLLKLNSQEENYEVRVLFL